MVSSHIVLEEKWVSHRKRERVARKRGMGRGKKSLLGLLGFKKTNNQREDFEDGPRHPRKVRLSDEDRGRWYGEPDIDRKAKEFIDKVHRNMDHDT